MLRTTGEVYNRLTSCVSNVHPWILVRIAPFQLGVFTTLIQVCANHVITSTMELRSNCNSDRAFVWQTLADFADEIPKSESLGIRFATADVAKASEVLDTSRVSPAVSDATAFKQFFDKGKKQAIQKRSKRKTPTNGDSTTSQTNQSVTKAEPDVETNLTNFQHKLRTNGEITNLDPAECPPLTSSDSVVRTV
ncbi:hypothetical protein AHF37_06796 [Paragonimus kellicotti]|nr:hypothetical protein AHF37_06796 [Paragonimus kellicotti]